VKVRDVGAPTSAARIPEATAASAQVTVRGLKDSMRSDGSPSARTFIVMERGLYKYCDGFTSPESTLAQALHPPKRWGGDALNTSRPK
jgi:hypothetical protein